MCAAPAIHYAARRIAAQAAFDLWALQLGVRMIQGEWRPLRIPSIKEREIDGDLLLHNTETGSVHHLNSVASLIWTLCDGSRDAGTITAEVADRYRKTSSDIAADVAEVLQELSRMGLVSPFQS